MRSPSASHKRTASSTSGVIGPYIKQNYVTLPLALNVGEALVRIRNQAKRGDIFYLYVVDDSKRLVGIVSIRNLLLSPDTEPLSEVVSRNVVTLVADAPKGEAAQRFAECRYLSLPVVDPDGRLVGVVHAHDLTPTFRGDNEKLFEDRHKGALFELLGIEAEDHNISTIKAARGRFPWLLVNMAGGAISAFLIHHLAPRLPNAVAFLAFVPILLIVCESVGMQTVSVVITKLRHAGDQASRVGWRELRIAGYLGLASAICVGPAAYFFESQEVASAVAITMVLATLGVSSIAFLLPVLIRRLGIDPSVSSGPVVLAIADCSILALFLLICFATSSLI